MDPMPKPSLRELQEWMRWVITDPRGVQDALAHPHPPTEKYRDRYHRPGEDWSNSIEDHSSATTEERLSIYSEGYYSRILEILSQDFSLTQVCLGETRFSKLIADYLKAFPSKTKNMVEVGRHLSLFLKNDELTQDIPFLSELAALEWSAIQSFYAETLPSLDAQSLSAIPENSWPGSLFELDPSIHLFSSHWPLHEIWESRSFLNLAQKDTSLLIYRTLYGKPELEKLEKVQWDILEAMKKNLTLEEICIQMEQVYGELPLMMNWFSDWIHKGFIRKIHFKDFTSH